MARLSNFHMLCPLIDQSSFLGVVGDSSNDCVVVTLGRNIVIRYKITDRKQVGSWSTREKLTSPVIYDHIGGQYVAVFNHRQIRVWKQEDEDLDTVKKYKFPEEIHTLLVCSGTKSEPAVLFQSGRICKLSTFLNQKEKIMEIWKRQERNRMNTILRADETLEDWYMITSQMVTYVILSARTPSKPTNLYFYVMKQVNEDDVEYSLQRRFTLQLAHAWLVGHTVIQHKESCSLLTLWSNGRIYRLNLDSYVVDDVSSLNVSEHSKITEPISPGSAIDSVKELFHVENKVALVALGSDHIALYGADTCQKGAVVYIVDIHSSVTGDLPWEALKESAAKQCLECYNAKEIVPRIWNAAGHLFIPSSDGRLVLASYELDSHTPLADLIGCLGKKTTSIKNNGMLNQHIELQRGPWLSALGSSQMDNNGRDVDKIEKVRWEEDMPLAVRAKLKPLVEKGLPESRICSIIFPELMADADDESISWCLAHFSDIPEDNLVNLLCFFLNRSAVTPKDKKGDFPKETIASSSDSLTVTSVEDSSKYLVMESPIKPMMNGDVSEPMDTTSCDSAVGECEKKGDFKIGHVYVKGRRRSLRVMKTDTPQTSEVNSSAKGMPKVEGEDCQELVEMETSPKCLEGMDKKRNSSMVLNGLDVVVEEGKKVLRCESSELEKMEVETVRKTSSVSRPDDRRPSEDEVEASTCIARRLNVPSALEEEESRIEGMALPCGQRKPVEKLLSLPVSSFILLPALRSKLPFHLALKLIRHLLWLLSSSEASAASCPSDEKLVEWLCHLLDAFYQQYTLAQDDDVMDTLRAVKEVLDFQTQLIDALKNLEPLLLQLKSGKIIKEDTCGKWYSIENIRLY